ncbi:TIR domain-containing protein [Arthrobacter bambusae]|uniref:TIR domain-containing protein n=1 Tax=Arthrobacter bambusae TaxID=1338426 RepID=UPI001F514DB0|nr:TIR domain-containing protein [Arthrobacter bambusae]
MARQVFFSFHYDRDISRVNIVRNSGFLQPETGFIDHSLWEESKAKGDTALKALIDEGLKGASVTAVLIGAQTARRKWVDYEIENSWNNGKGLLGIRIHKLKNFSGLTDTSGADPFAHFSLKNNGGSLTDQVKIYDWVADDGYENLSTWIDEAAAARGR